MLLYCWGLIVEKNLYSYPEVLAILEIVENTGGKHLKKGQVGVGRSGNLSCWLHVPSSLACKRHEMCAMLFLLRG